MIKNNYTNIDTNHGTYKSYITGFILSVILTVAAFWMVMNPEFSSSTIIIIIVALALIQIFIHLFYFLHLTSTPEPFWNIISFIFTILIVALLVGGTVWIMINMMDNLMPAHHVMPDQ
jgi:cytochrome o ubiquinol oxidase subunit IV